MGEEGAAKEAPQVGLLPKPPPLSFLGERGKAGEGAPPPPFPFSHVEGAQEGLALPLSFPRDGGQGEGRASPLVG